MADYQAGEHLRFQLFDQDIPFVKASWNATMAAECYGMVDIPIGMVNVINQYQSICIHLS